MYPDAQANIKKLKLVAIVFLLLVLTVFIYYIFTRVSFKKYQITTTFIPSSQPAHITNDYVYGYNGAFFYKKSLEKNGDTTILMKSMKFPKVETLVWAGDDGVAVLFSNNGIVGSAIEEESRAQDLQLYNNNNRYLWYIDFKTEKISLLSTDSIEKEKVAYSSKSKSIYFARTSTREGDTVSNMPTTISRFSTAAHTTEIVKSFQNTYHLSSLFECGDYEICWTKYDEKSTVFGLNKSTEKAVASSNLRFIKNSDTQQYIYSVSPVTTKVSLNDSDFAQNIHIVQHELNNNSTSTIDTVLISSPLLYIVNDDGGDSFYILGANIPSRSSVSYIAVGKSLLGKHKTNQVKFINSPSNIDSAPIVQSSNKKGMSLIAIGDSPTYYITHPNNVQVSLSPSSPTKNEVTTLYSKCSSKGAGGVDYNPDSRDIKLSVVYDENFAQNTKNAIQCIAASSIERALQYNFSFVGTDPANGRYVTD